MAVIGTLIGKGIFGDSAFGTKPVVPELRNINIDQLQQQAIAGNQAAMPQLQELAAGMNQFNAKQIRAALDFQLPGLTQQAIDVIGSQLRGEVPMDVQQLIQNRSAAWAFDRGVQGGTIQRNVALRDLGLTSIGQQQQGLSNFGALAQRLAPQQFDVSSMFFSPQQRLAFDVNERDSQFKRQFAANQIAAAPDPFAQAMTQAIINDEQAIMELVGSVVGMAGGICWVAREVFGESSILWRAFRCWLFLDAPKWLLRLYWSVGPSVARWLKKHDQFKPPVRRLMLVCIAYRYAN